MSGITDRFRTGHISNEKVEAIPPNAYGLTPIECLTMSIVAVPGVIRVEIAPDPIGTMHWWRAELQYGCNVDVVMKAIDEAIDRCCDPARHTRAFHPLDALEAEYNGLSDLVV